jgi:hypothetical protein
LAKIGALGVKKRQLKRTLKGLLQVVKNLAEENQIHRALIEQGESAQPQVIEPFKGEPCGLEKIGHRVKQTLEELRRVKGEFISLTEELDKVIREATRSIQFGPPPMTDIPRRHVDI